MVPTEPDPEFEAVQRRHNKVLRISLSATCVDQGQVLVIRMTGPAGSNGSGVVTFADGSSHESTYFFTLDQQGRHDWRLPIPPTVPDGPANVGAGSVQDPNDQDTWGTADARFTVRGPNGC